MTKGPRASLRSTVASHLPAAPLPHTRFDVAVETALRPGSRYHVAIGAGLLVDQVPSLVFSPKAPAKRVLLVVDAGLLRAPPGRATLQSLIETLESGGALVSLYRFAPSEKAKSLTTLQAICAAAAHAKLERRDAIIALGGGICTDLAGFAAAVYRRGIRFISCPTTLLSMVDAAVGGKTGVNLSIRSSGKRGSSTDLLKNMIGAFWQPTGVICDVALLATLPGRILRAGMGECCKHAMLAEQFGQPGDWAQMEECIDRCLRSDRKSPSHADLASWAQLIAMNVQIKARVVGLDEREELADLSGGGRMALNLGHTYAHALETLPGIKPVTLALASSASSSRLRKPSPRALPGPIQHGEAVTLGLIAALRTSEQLGWMPKGSADGYIHERLIPWGLVHRVSRALPVEKVLTRMLSDKKVDAGKLRLILPIADLGSGLPGVKVTSDVPVAIVKEVIASLHRA